MPGVHNPCTGCTPLVTYSGSGESSGNRVVGVREPITFLTEIAPGLRRIPARPGLMAEGSGAGLVALDALAHTLPQTIPRAGVTLRFGSTKGAAPAVPRPVLPPAAIAGEGRGARADDEIGEHPKRKEKKQKWHGRVLGRGVIQCKSRRITR